MDVKKKIVIFCIFILIFSSLAFGWCLLGIGTTCDEKGEQLKIIETEYTTFTETTKYSDHTNSLLVSSKPMYVWEEGEMKNVEDAVSLKRVRDNNGNLIFEVRKIYDGEHDIEVIDYNYTSILFSTEISNADDLNKEIPLKIDGVQIHSSSLSEIGKKNYHIYRVNNILLHNISFGFNSTTIKVESNATAPSIKDARVEADHSGTNYNTQGLQYWDTASYNRSSVMCNNFTDNIPVDATLSGGIFNFYGDWFSGANNSAVAYLIDKDIDETTLTWSNLEATNYKKGEELFPIIHHGSSDTWYNETMNPAGLQDAYDANEWTGCWRIEGLGGDSAAGLAESDGTSGNNWSLFITYSTNEAPTAPTLNLPLNNTNHSSLPHLNWTNATDADGDIINYYLEVDNDSAFGSPDYVNASITEEVNPTGDTPTALSDGTYYWRVLAYDSEYNSSWNSINRFTYDSSAPEVILYQPTNTTLDHNSSIDLKYNANDLTLDTVWYNLDYGANTTLTGNTTFDTSVDGHILFLYANDSFSNENWTNVSFGIALAPTTPDIYPEVYTRDYYFNGICENSTVEIGDSGLLNYAFLLSTNSPPDFVVQNSTNTTYSNNTLLNNTYYFMCESNNNLTNSTPTSVITYDIERTIILNSSLGFEDNVYEGSMNDFFVNLTYNNLSNYVGRITGVTLEYGGSSYAMTGEQITNDTIEWAYSDIVAVPSSQYLYDLSFEYYNGSSGSETIGNYTQTVNEIDFALCNDSTYSTIFVNFTFADEEDNSRLNATFDSLFNFSVNSDFANQETYSFADIGENFSYAFCANQNTTLYVLADIDYESTGYPQKTYYNLSMNLNNITTNELLYLTSSSEGQYVTFQLINTAENPIGNAYVTVRKGGILYESGYTDAAGTITFFLDPDRTYEFEFSKSGYTTYTSTFRPTQSIYTITLGSEEPVEENYNIGIVISITPSGDLLKNDTAYNFSLNIESGYFILQDAGFMLVNASDLTTLGTASCSSDLECSCSLTLNTDSYKYLSMQYWWKVNDTYMNGTRGWSVEHAYGHKGYFNMFKDDLAMLDGKSGFDDFTKALFSFFFIFAVVGVLTYTTGIYSPLAILGEITASVIFLDLINMMPNPVGPFGAVPHFVAIVVSLMFVSYAFYEARRNY